MSNDLGFIGYNEKVVRLVEKIPIFSGLNKKNLEVLLNLTKIMRFDRGETIIEEKKYDATIYFLLEGAVSIVKNDIEIALLKDSGAFFGEMAIIDELPRSADVIACDGCMLMSLDPSIMDKLDIEGMDNVSKQFFKTFSEKLSIRLRDLIEENFKLKKRIKQLENK